MSRDFSVLLELPPTTAYTTFDELKAILERERQAFQNACQFPLESIPDAGIEEFRVRFAGRKSPLQELLKSIRNIDASDRKQAGALINELKTFIEEGVGNHVARWQERAESRRLESEAIDPTLPLPDLGTGVRHPISVTMQHMIDVLRRQGFTVVDGPEIDRDFYNFEALNQPADHPARDMSDTFFFSLEWLLRSHTSNVQAHALIERGAPIKIICPGFVYRRDYDMTHSPCFRQLECLVVDKGIHMGHMRHTISTFVREVFGQNVKTRFRSSYFPFVEPGAELDIQCQQCFGAGCRSCKGTGWSELGGCGLVNRNVLKLCGVDPDVYSGFAFGFGLDRMAMSRYAIADLRAFFEADISLFRSLRI